MLPICAARLTTLPSDIGTRKDPHAHPARPVLAGHQILGRGHRPERQTGAAAFDPIDFTVRGDQVIVSCPGAEFSVGRHQLAGLAADDDRHEVRERRFVDAAAFGSALPRVARVMSRGEASRSNVQEVGAP